jgi:hypothetical protein
LYPLGVLGLRNGIIYHGEWMEAEDIDRGRLLLRDVEGWTGRYYLTLHWSMFFMMLGAMLGFLTATIVVGTSVVSMTPSIIGYFIGFLIGYGLIALSFRSSVRKGGPVPGLYENGVQLPRAFRKSQFLPYDEIEAVKVGRLLFFDSVRLIPRYRKRKWRVSKILLGEEGTRVLQRLVAQPPEATGTPRLVLYPQAKDTNPKEEGAVPPDLFDSRW